MFRLKRQHWRWYATSPVPTICSRVFVSALSFRCVCILVSSRHVCCFTRMYLLRFLPNSVQNMTTGKLVIARNSQGKIRPPKYVWVRDVRLVKVLVLYTGRLNIEKNIASGMFTLAWCQKHFPQSKLCIKTEFLGTHTERSEFPGVHTLTRAELNVPVSVVFKIEWTIFRILWSKAFLKIRKTIYFRGDLSDISAKKEVMVTIFRRSLGNAHNGCHAIAAMVDTIEGGYESWWVTVRTTDRLR